MKDKSMKVTSVNDLTVGDQVYWDCVDRHPFFELEEGCGIVVHTEERVAWILPESIEHQALINQYWGGKRLQARPCWVCASKCKRMIMITTSASTSASTPGSRIM